MLTCSIGSTVCNGVTWHCGRVVIVSLVSSSYRAKSCSATKSKDHASNFQALLVCHFCVLQVHVERCILNRCCAVTSQFCDIISSARPCSVKTNVLQKCLKTKVLEWFASAWRSLTRSPAIGLLAGVGVDKRNPTFEKRSTFFTLLMFMSVCCTFFV